MIVNELFVFFYIAAVVFLILMCIVHNVRVYKFKTIDNKDIYEQM